MSFTDVSDEQLDRDWKPSGRRPQSTIAKSFSAELMDIFRIENSVADLDESVTEKKQRVDRTTKELASLEARLREMEDRLRRNGVATTTTTTSSSTSRAPIPSFQSPDRPQGKHSTPQKQRSSKAPSSGNMPPTPGASEGEYDFITRADYT